MVYPGGGGREQERQGSFPLGARARLLRVGRGRKGRWSLRLPLSGGYGAGLSAYSGEECCAELLVKPTGVWVTGDDDDEMTYR